MRENFFHNFFEKTQNVIKIKFFFCNKGVLLVRMEYFGVGIFLIIGVQRQCFLSSFSIAEVHLLMLICNEI